MTGKDETVHLVAGYKCLRRDFYIAPWVRITWRWPWEKWFRSAPEPACRMFSKHKWYERARKIQMLSLYDNPEDEAKISCVKCQDWLTIRRNRQMVTKGGVEEYMRESMGIKPESAPEGSLLTRQLFPELGEPELGEKE